MSVAAVQSITPQEAHRLRKRQAAGLPLTAREEKKLAAYTAANPAPRKPVRSLGVATPSTPAAGGHVPAAGGGGSESAAAPAPLKSPPPAELAGVVMLEADAPAAPAPDQVAAAPAPPPDPNAPPPPPPRPPGALSGPGAAAFLKQLTAAARKDVEVKIAKGEIEMGPMAGLFLYVSDPIVYDPNADWVALNYLGNKTLPFEAEIITVGTPLLARAVIPRKKKDSKQPGKPGTERPADGERGSDSSPPASREVAGGAGAPPAAGTFDDSERVPEDEEFRDRRNAEGKLF